MSSSTWSGFASTMFYTGSYRSIIFRVDNADARLFWDGAIRARIAHWESTTHGGGPRSTSAGDLQALEDEASTMKLAVFSLLEHRNSRVSINRLPVEVLARVFSFCAGIDIPGAITMEPSPGTRRRRNLGWITVTFVCRRWRQAAFDHAALWSTVKFVLGREWAKEMISRAKSVPLDILVVYTLPDWEADLIIKNIRCIEVLRLGEDVSADAFMDVLSTPVPLLKELRLKSQGTVHFPDNFLGDCAPNLHTFSVRNPSNFPWLSSIFRNLIFFQLTDFSPPGLSLEGLLHALNNMHRLERLILQACLPRDSKAGSNITVKLPCLTYFEGRDALHAWADLLGHFDIPATATISLTMSYDSTEPQINAFFDSFIPTLAAFLRVHGTSAEAMSRLSLNTNLMFMITATRGIHSGNTYAQLNFQPHIWAARERGSPIVRAARVLAALSSEHLKDLSVKGQDTGWSPSHWLDIMARAPELQTISAEGPAAEMLCIALQMSTHSTSKDATKLGAVRPSVICLPALQQLSLRYVDFATIVESTAECPSFQDCLATRAKDKMLRKLVIWECKIRSEWVDDLRRVVSDVQWDDRQG